MATKFKEGDLVQIKTREATADDVKSGLYYGYFGGVQGSIQKIYASGEAAIEANLDSLAEDIARRHEEMRLAMQNKWLDGLSEEAKNRLTPQERAFTLRYNILVSQDDLEVPKAIAEPRRLTSADLAAREEEELARRLGKNN